VSCQAEGNEPLNSPQVLAAMSRAAVLGGAVAIRAERPENIIQIKKQINVPVIGLYKKKYPDSEIYITPTLHDAIEVLKSGADVIALDATDRPRPNKERLDQIVKTLRKQNDLLLMADISTYEEGMAAARLSFDLIGTTLSGYTTVTNSKAINEKPDFELLSALVNQLGEKTPIIAEGRIGTGIGGGIIIDGKLIRGQGNAGEFGHICIEKNGRQCRCGRKGCLETYVSRKLLQE
jgi:N-acylglucosamine-6-phosphate 2-epimerase